MDSLRGRSSQMQSPSGKGPKGKLRNQTRRYRMLAKEQQSIGMDLGNCVFKVSQENNDRAAIEK